jgi:hypothetical protein
MSKIGSKFNYDEVFYRTLTITLLSILESEFEWVNRFSAGDVKVEIPFYYKLFAGDERFLLDTFVDDIVSDSARVNELNTDKIPRGHLSLKSFRMDSSEFANPNVFLRQLLTDDKEFRKILTKVSAIPVTVSYDIEILLSSQIDIFKCSEKIMDMFGMYRFMWFDFNYMNIDSYISIPDEKEITVSQESNMSSDNTIKMTFPVEVHTYYPAWRRPVTGASFSASPLDDKNKAWSNAYNYNNSSFPSNDIILYPKKVKWYSQIDEMRQRGRNTPDNFDDNLLSNPSS